MMVWQSDVSYASFCVQYYQNPGTETAAFLVYTQVHGLFWYFAQHCTHLQLGSKPFSPSYVFFKSLNPIKIWCSWLIVWVWVLSTQPSIPTNSDSPVPAPLLRKHTYTDWKLCYDWWTVSLLVCVAVRHPFEAMLRFFLLWDSCGFVDAGCLLCSLQLLLGLTIWVILRSVSCRISNHILLSHIWDSSNMAGILHIYIPHEQGGPLIPPGAHIHKLLVSLYIALAWSA
jgi:hypothetical protein